MEAIDDGEEDCERDLSGSLRQGRGWEREGRALNSDIAARLGLVMAETGRSI